MPGIADWVEDLYRRRMQEGWRGGDVTPLPAVEEGLRQNVEPYQFAKPQAPSKGDPTLFQQFALEAGNQVGKYLSAPGGLGLAGANIRMPQSRPLPTNIPPGQYDRLERIYQSRPLVDEMHLVRDYRDAVTRRLRERQRDITSGRNDLINSPTPQDWRGSYRLPSEIQDGRPAGSASVSTRPTTEDFNWARTQLPEDASLAQRTTVATQRAIWRAQQAATPPRGYTQGAVRPFDPPPLGTQAPAPLGAPDIPPPLQRLTEEQIAAARQRGVRNEQDRRAAAQPQSNMPAWQRYQEGGPRLVTDIGDFVGSEAPRPRQGAAATAAALRQQTADRTSPSLMTRLSTASARGGRRLLPHEMEFDPIQVRERGAPEERWEINFKPGGKYEGSITGYANKRDKTFQISGSGISNQYHNTGAGQEGYRRLFEKARKLGYTIKSDSTQSDYSYRLYRDVFPRMGWKATRAASYRHNPNAMYPHTSRDANWTMVSQPPEPLDLPPMSLADKMLLRGIEPSPFDPPLGVPRRRRRND